MPPTVQGGQDRTVTVLFGGALTNAGLLANLSPGIVVFSLVAILAIRPIAAWLSLAGTSMPATERLVVSAYGIRGLGSIYYLAYAVQKTTFDGQDIMWTTVAFVILLSIILHGVTVTPVMSLIDRRRRGGVTEQETAALETKAAE